LTGDLYDHLIAVIVVGVLFLTAVIAAPNISYVNLLQLDQQQLRNIALTTLKTMLLDPGYPVNWGSSENFTQNAVKKFGLALYKSSSLYVLDADKVQRLVVDNPVGHLEYNRTIQLLELEGYGFNLEIIAPFNVTVKDLSTANILEFEITVTFNDDKPVPNAIVEATIVYSYFVGAESADERYAINWIIEKETTNELGKCVIKYILAEQFSDLMVILHTTVADVATITTIHGNLSEQNIGQVNLVDDTIIITRPFSLPNDERTIENIVVFTEEGVVSLYNGTGTDILNYGAFNVWNKTFPGLKDMNPILLIVNIEAVERATGRKGILIVGPYPNYVGSRVVKYGGTPKGVAVTLQRSVNISGMTYLVKFTFWKEDA
jgi:hypothetical protein